MPSDICSVRINRLNLLLRKLIVSSPVSSERLMETAEITSKRMLQRDIRYLKEFYGADISYDFHSQTYSCKSPGSFSLQLRLSKDEITVLTAGIDMARHFLPHLSGACSDVWNKLEDILPPELIQYGKELGDSAKVALPVARMDAAIFSALLEAAYKEQAVCITYCSPYSGKGEKRHTLSPWKFYFQEHAWYMLAWNHFYNKEGVWRISRVRSAEAADEEYVRCPVDFDYDTIVSSAWFSWSKDLKYCVELLIKPPLAASAAEIVWHPTQTVERLEDGSIILRARVSDTEPVKWWVKAHSDWVTINKITELHHCCAEDIFM